MAACEDLYKEWEKRGNFCHKSEEVARQIEQYIEYRKRNRLGGYEINRNALHPMMMIEEEKSVHTLALKELRKYIKKVSARRISRRLVVEIINKANQEVPVSERINEIPQVRSRMDGYQHAIGSISYESRVAFDELKDAFGKKDNNAIMEAMIKICSERREYMLETLRIMEKEKNENMRIISEV